MYIRHAALLTPKGLDNDFNYLTGVERKLDLARKEAIENGIDYGNGGSSRGKASLSGGFSRFERILKESGAIIQRAPPGLTRARTNATKLAGKYVDGWLDLAKSSLTFSRKKDQLLWTVEWVHPDGSSRLGSCNANQSISDAYKLLLKHLGSDKDVIKPESKGVRGLWPGSAPERGEDVSVSITENTESSTIGISGTPEKDDFYFYLHLPRQPSRRPVLMSLMFDAPPSSFLRGQVIVEYPTIYVLGKAPTDLPSRFVLDAKFFKHRRKEEIPVAVPQNGLEDGEIEEEKAPDWNEERLEKLGEVLTQDLQGLKSLVSISEIT